MDTRQAKQDWMTQDWTWTGEGDGSEHLTPEWREGPMRLTEEIRAVTGEKSEITVSFAGTAKVNGVYVLAEGLRGGLPQWRQQGGDGWRLFFESGYWTIGGYYRQRFDPASPAPKQRRSCFDFAQGIHDVVHSAAAARWGIYTGGGAHPFWVLS